jgi:hypothetical protein
MVLATVGPEVERHLEMIPIVSGYMARFTVRFQSYIQARRISQDMVKFSVLLKREQNGSKTNQTDGEWPKYFNDLKIFRDKLTHLLSYKRMH